MEVPYVNAVGVTVRPAEYSRRIRRRPLGLRILAAALVLVFGLAVVVTTVISVGTYCLTSDGGDTRSWPAR